MRCCGCKAVYPSMLQGVFHAQRCGRRASFKRWPRSPFVIDSRGPPPDVGMNGAYGVEPLVSGSHGERHSSAVVQQLGRPHAHAVALLIIDRQSSFFPNLKKRSDAAEIYIRCAALLAKSALAAQHDITVVTNDAALVGAWFSRLGVPGNAKVEQREFISQLPLSAPHRAAHHKLDLLRDLAGGDPGRYSMIVDLDAVFLRGLRFDELPEADEIGCYDISSMMVSESQGRSADDIRELAAEHVAAPRWFGGEFIIARGAMFHELVNILDEVEGRYWALRETLYHVGDEALVSSALNLYLGRGGRVLDVGARNVILRWWTARRTFPQVCLRTALDHAVLHLPADKEFLALQAGLPFSSGEFLKSYRRYAKIKLIISRLKNMAMTYLPGCEAGFVASV